MYLIVGAILIKVSGQHYNVTIRMISDTTLFLLSDYPYWLSCQISYLRPVFAKASAGTSVILNKITC